ncbi:LPD23 domain-containing protein [Flavobacterium sp. FlaQc-50]|uniref:LPD23 domain-containing protein n=1 Tax=unclassified Flavobacterium TaxID=196869 RepID=UPI003757D07E
MPDPRKKLYQALTSNNFDLGSYDEFNSKMDNPESRKKLYEAAGSNDFDLGSFDDFESKIGGKKKSDSSSTSSGTKSDLAPETGSSAGQTNSKNSNGFPKIESNNPLDQFIPQPSKAGKNKEREKKLQKELSTIKVTPENMDLVSAKTDELSALQKESEKTIQAERNYKVNQLEKSFYDATKDNNDDAVAEQRLQDAIQVKGVWNNVKNIAKNAYNTAVQSIATTQPGAIGLIKYKSDTDPLADQKKQVITEAKNNKEKLTDGEINQRAQELFKAKEKDNLFIDRANSFLDNLPEKDKEVLKQDRAVKADHLEEDNLKRVKVVSAMRAVAESKISEYKNIESQLTKLKDKNQEFPEDLYQRYQSLGNEIKNIGSELQKNEDYILKNKKDLGTAKQEFDLFKREYGDFENFIGNIGASASELGTGLLGATNYVASFSPNTIDRVRALQGQEIVNDLNKGIEENRSNLRKPVESVESAEGFINYASDLVANQIPILVATSTGIGGLSTIGASSAGKKFTDMNNEVLKGKAQYSPLEMAVAPLLYGGAEVVSELPTMGILKKGGRVLESVARNEASLLTKTAKQKAKDWAEDFGIDMSKEMAGEQFTNFAQNFNDKYVLGKKDVNLLDNTGQVFKDTFTLTSILKAAPHAFGAVVQPFQSKSDLGKLDENSRKIIEFSKQLNSEDLTPTEKQVIQKQIETATAESSKIVANTIGKIDSMPSELYDEVVNLNTKAGEIKSQAREIADGNLSNKKQLLEGLQEEYKSVQEQRNSIIEGKTSAVEVLPLKEQEKLKKQALEDLVTELNPDGKKNMTITNEQILERANEIYSDSKKNEKVSSNNEVSNSKDLQVVEKTTPDTKKPAIELDPAPSVSKSEENRVVEYTNGKGEKATLNTNDIELNEKGNKFLFTENGNRIGHIEIKNQEGNDVSVSLSGIFNPSLEKKGIGTIMYKKTAEFLKENYNKDLVSDKQRTPDSEALWAKLEREGNAEVIGDKSKGKIADYQYKYVFNEAPTKNDVVTDENLRSRIDETGGQGEDTRVQDTVNVPTSKGEVTEKLQKINQETFGLDEKQSKANTVVMEKTLETIAKRAGISKEEMFDKIIFEKGNSETVAELSKKGKALFQIAGQNANLKEEIRDNLKRAQELEKNGKSDKEIWIATGWQKGADGKWRVEFDDSKMELNDGYQSMRNYTLDEAIEYDELFDLYPELKDVKFSVIPRLGSMKGAFMPAKNLIMINGELSPEEVKSTLLHEIQHIIQSKEGFATGGTPKMAVDYLNSKISRLKLAKNLPSSVIKAADKLSKSLFDGIDVNESKDNFVKELNNIKNKLSEGEWDVYQSIAGEVESRNVQNRMNMNAEERKKTPLSNTETKILPKEYSDDPDVHKNIGRDEQIVLFQGEKGAMLAEDGKFIIYALEDPNVSTPLHELAHVYEHYLTDSERKTILDDAGQKEWNRETSEHFARGFEKYLADGISPNPEMKKLFEDFKKWLTDIYKGITNSEIDIELSPEMQRIYDEMLGARVNKDKSITVGNYTYQYSDNQWIAKDKDGNIDKKKDIPKKVLEIHAENFDFTKGETALEAQKINDISTWEEDVAEHSNNPVEVAETLLNAQTMDATEGLDTKSKNIAESIGGKGVERSNFAERAGKKGMKDIPGSLALQYFSKKGKGSGLDIIAQNAEIAMYGDYDSQNPRITEDDVFEFINDNPRGTSDYLNSVKKEKINALKNAFTDLTGLPANDKYLSMAIDQQQSKDKFINEYMTEIDVLSDEDLLNLQTELEQFNNTENEKYTQPGGEKESPISDSQESEGKSGVQEDSGPEGKRNQKEVTEKTSTEQFLDWLDEMENNLDQFGKENLSSGIPIVVAKASIQAMRAAVKAGMAIAEVIQAGLNAVKQSEWYINLSPADKIQAEKDFNDSFGNPEIDIENVRKTENLLNRSVSDKISEDDAYDEVSKTFQKEREELRNKKPAKEYLRDAYRNFVKRFTDRQYLSKTLLNKSGLKNTKNLIINAHGASGKAKLLFEEAYNKIYKGLTRAERNTLDEIIQAKRFIAIDENREARDLEPVSHPNFIDKNKSEKFLSKLEKVLGNEKYADLEKRAEHYFKTYKDLLKQVYDNGLISKESYDSMSDVDYQPRVFLQFVTDFNGDLAEGKKTNNLETGGLSSEQIKSMSEGDANSLVLNSEWLLTNSLLARQKAIAMNNINKRFMTEEYPKALKRFESLDPKNLQGDDKRFYKYFKELSSKVIDNPYIGETESGSAKYKYDKSPANFQKAYYYEDGKQHQFFLEQDLYDSWTDNIGGFLDSRAKELLSYASGSALVKGIATGNNPAFPIVNTPRDFMFTTTFSDQYSNFVPKAMLQVGKDAVKSFKELRNHDNSDILKKYIEYGGAMDFLSSEGRLKKNSMLGKVIEKTIDPKVKDIAKNVFSKVTLSKISEYSEMMFRLGIFQRSINNQLKDLGLKDISEVTDKQQLDDIYNEAVTNARSILDFNQGGVITKDLEAVVPYINVAFQGGRVAANAFEKDPVGTTSRVLQVATLASAIPIGISLALLSAMKPEDDDDKSAMEIYLHAMEGISQYQKMKYMNIPVPIKDASGEYMVIKIAKAQELSPVMSVTDDIYNNMIRSMVGKEKKSPGRIIDDAAFTFNSNVMPIDFTSPAGFFTRTPIIKGTLTYTTGYDFFRDEPLSTDIGKVPLPVEGINNPNVEDFYKKLGEDHGLSPIRSKAFVESLITGPNTNPFVGMLYGGADAAVSDKDMKKIGEELAKSVYKSTGKRVISYSSQYNRDLAAQKDLQDKIDQINIEKYKMKAEFNQLAKDYINKDISKADLTKKLEALDPADRKRMTDKIKDKIRLQGIDGTILDIKYEQGNDVKALMIMHYYGDISDGSKDSKEILRQMKRAKGILTPGVILEYKKLKIELEPKKAPK